MSEDANIPHIENVRLVKKSNAHGGAPGFNSHFTLVMTIGLLGLFLVGYFLLH